MRKVIILSLALILLLGIMSHGTSGYFSDTESGTTTICAWVEEGCTCHGFNVSDFSGNDRRIFTYDVSDSSASFTGFFDLNKENGKPSGVASVGDYIYVLDQSGKQVYQYDCCGNLLGISKVLRSQAIDDKESGIGNPAGLAIYGDYMWVVCWGPDDVIYRYSLNGAFTGPETTISADFEIPLYKNDDHDKENTNPTGLAIDGDAITATLGYLYVLDSVDEKFYRYTTDGSSVTISRVLAESIASGGGALYGPAGTMFDGTYLWVVDDRQAQDLDRAYKYDMTNLFPDDGYPENALWQFDLDADNKGSTGL